MFFLLTRTEYCKTGLWRTSDRIDARKWLLDARIYKHITFHCIRTTIAIRLINKGADIYTIAHLMGHKSVDSTQVYARITPKIAQDAISILDDGYF